MPFTSLLGKPQSQLGNIEPGIIPPISSTDYAQFEVGGVIQALAQPSGNTLLRDADPAVYYALDFFTYVINTYPGPRLIAAAATAGVTSLTMAVAQPYPYMPQYEFLESQFSFPLLCVGRKRTTTRRHTAGWEGDRCQFDLLYALPPMNAGQSEQVLPALNAVYQAIRKKTTQGFDPGYTPPGGAMGQSPWQLSGVESIGFGHELNESESATFGFLEGTGNLYFPCLRMSGYFVERDMYLPSKDKFLGADIEVDLLGPDGSVAANFMNLFTQQAPTVKSISPSAGGIAGGTAVTITGTLFLPGPKVNFGPYQAKNVVWVSATSVNCTTPPISGPGTVSVTVINRDGQAGSLQNAFTYS